MSVLDIDDFEIIEPAVLVIRRSRAAWEAEQMEALRERRKARQPITSIEVARWQWKRLAALVPQTNARRAIARIGLVVEDRRGGVA